MTAIAPFVVPEVRMEDVVAIMDVMGDVNPIHVDEELVAELGLRGPVNQGPANLAYVLNMLIRWSGSPESIRHVDVRFRAISCPGDRLVATGRVTALTGGHGSPVAECRFELVRDGGEVILDGTAEVAVAPELAATLEVADAR